MELKCDGSEVVVRLPPFLPNRLQENAEDTFADDLEKGRKPPRYGVSVLATRCRDGETLMQAVDRVCRETALSGKKIAVATGTSLRNAGFDVIADPSDKEPRHHLVGNAPFEAVPKVEALASLLEVGRMDNPAWVRGAAA